MRARRSRVPPVALNPKRHLRRRWTLGGGWAERRANPRTHGVSSRRLHGLEHARDLRPATCGGLSDSVACDDLDGLRRPHGRAPTCGNLTAWGDLMALLRPRWTAALWHPASWPGWPAATSRPAASSRMACGDLAAWGGCVSCGEPMVWNADLRRPHGPRRRQEPMRCLGRRNAWLAGAVGHRGGLLSSEGRVAPLSKRFDNVAEVSVTLARLGRVLGVGRGCGRNAVRRRGLCGGWHACRG